MHEYDNVGDDFFAEGFDLSFKDKLLMIAIICLLIAFSPIIILFIIARFVAIKSIKFFNKNHIRNHN